MNLPVTLVTRITQTHEGPIGVPTRSSWMTATIVGEALIYVLALRAVATPTIPTAALERALQNIIRK